MTTAPLPLDRNTLRPAVFLGCDNAGEDGRFCLNASNGRIADVAPAIRRLNDAGYLVFIIANRSDVAGGRLTQDDMEKQHVRIRLEFRQLGARIDDLRACPYHPDATVSAYKRDSDWRKPKPGMIYDLMRYWPVDLERSFVVANDDTDMVAAQNAQIRGYLFEGGDFREFVESILSHENPD